VGGGVQFPQQSVTQWISEPNAGIAGLHLAWPPEPKERVIEHENNLFFPVERKARMKECPSHGKVPKKKRKEKKKPVKRKVPSTITRHPYSITMGKHCCMRTVAL
jgi:hypothetical protein